MTAKTLPLARLNRSISRRITFVIVSIGTLLSASAAYAQPAATQYPITLDVCGAQPVTIAKAPTRIVTPAPNITEYFLALGLGSSVVGDFGGGLPVSGYKAEYANVPIFPTSALTLEQITAAKPDLVYAGYGYGLEQGTPLSPDGLASRGIPTMVIFGSCSYSGGRQNQGATASALGVRGQDLQETYADIRNIGKIFSVGAKAEALIAAMQDTVDKVQAAVKGRAPRSVFLFNGGHEAPGTAAGLSTPNALITLAGGRNIFNDLKEDYTKVSWEQVIAAQPDCVIVKNGSNSGTRGEDSIAFLKSSPITANLPAVKNDCFLILNQDQLTPGPLNAWAVQAVAHFLYPDAIAAPAPTP
ncbi:MAG: ABC transporter substrate-binding protein [Methylobacteriaceae bacterium]|nr:ABC transporter substrate-binding protein [Methylobacteriaceae bacterium]